MSKAEILAELSRLTPQDRADIQAKLDELASNEWLDRGELSDGDRESLESALAAYEKSPNSGSGWDEVKARIESKLR